ncbi:HAMP domain-containing protein [Candidatus Dependentiae bacterium]|nr:HAMP domain-containing protein [Candidatus Dependentiae bacterium]
MTLNNKIKFGLKTRFIIYIFIFFIFFNTIILYLYFIVKKRIAFEIDKSLINISKIILIQNFNDTTKTYISKANNPAPDSIITSNLIKEFIKIKNEIKLDNIHLIDKNFKILVTTGSDNSTEFIKMQKDKFEIESVFKTGKTNISEMFKSYDGKNILICYSPVRDNGKTIAVLAVEASNDILIVFSRLLDDLLIIAAISLAFILFISLMFTKYILKPIGNIVLYVKNASAGNFTEKISISKRNDEINFLAESFNEMIENISLLNRVLQEKEYAATIRADRMESKLKESERLYFLGTMAAVVAHEVRNPLSGISGFLELLERKIEKTEPIDRLILKIKLEIEKLNKVTTDFLFLSADKKIEIKPINLFKITANCIKLIENELKEKKIIAVNNTDETDNFFGDELYFEKALLNIFLNAVSAIDHENGYIEIKSMYEENDKNRLTITISDNGSGFDNTEKDRLFDIFYTTKQTGTGLGLAITKRIIELHRGDIEIYRKNDITTVKLKMNCIKPQLK